MLLAVDVGNSDITLGLFYENQWKHRWRIPSVGQEHPELFYAMRVREFFFESNLKISHVNHVVLSSVVPSLTDKILSVLQALFSHPPLVLKPDLYKRLPFDVLNPYEIGSDLVANAMAARHRFDRTCIVVDFGTALTFTTVSPERILGVAIVPGLRTSIRSLSQNTAQMFDVPLEMPESVLGKNTVQAIQAGILVGYEGLVNKMLHAIRMELNDSTIPAIATGGLSAIISSLRESFVDVDPYLTLDGLRLVNDFFKRQ